jgi:hypothetical protein
MHFKAKFGAFVRIFIYSVSPQKVPSTEIILLL